MEALTHVLTQQRRAAAEPRGDRAVASVAPGTGHSSEEAGGIPSRSPKPLSDDDFEKVKAAVRNRDGPKRSTLSPPTPAARGESATSPAGGVPAQGSPSTPREKQQPRWGSTSHGGGGGFVDGGTTSKDGGNAGRGIDQRLFEPVLRAILSGEGDHVLRRSLLCHSLLKDTKSGACSTGGGGGSSSGGASRGTGGGAGANSKGSGAGAAASPLGGGRRKDGKGSKGGKAKKRDRDRAREQDELGRGNTPSTSGVSPSARGGADSSSPLDASREMSRLAELAAADCSLQSTLILVKTLLCAVDPGTQAPTAIESARQSSTSSSLQPGSRSGRNPVEALAVRGGAADGGRGSASGSSSVAGLTLKTAPLRALTGKGLSGWSDVLELLRREKYREWMGALRGRPSLTVCSGKADMKGRLEAKGESSGVITAVQVR